MICVVLEFIVVLFILQNLYEYIRLKFIAIILSIAYVFFSSLLAFEIKWEINVCVEFSEGLIIFQLNLRWKIKEHST